MFKRIPAIGLQDRAKLPEKYHAFALLRLIQEVKNQLIMKFAEIELFMNDAEVCCYADSKLLADDAVRNKRELR
jgi:hypothetical protein